MYALDQNGDICKCVKECRREIWVDHDKVSDFECGHPQLVKNPEKQLKNNDIILKAIPNPFTDHLAVSVSFTDKLKAIDPSGFQVELTNVNGTVLQSKKYAEFSKNPSFYTMGYPSGSYFVMLKSSNGQIQSTKVVKIQ